MFKKTITLVISIIMVLTMSSCKKEGTVNSGYSASGDGILCEEYTTLTAFYNQNQYTDDGKHKTFEEAAKITNVGIKCTIPKSNSDFNQAFNLMIASGEIPDIVQCYDVVNFNQLGTEGAFVPLNEYFDVMPNVKKILEENPQIRANITAFDGNIYHLPHIPGGVASIGWFIREDWLDKLDLEIPVGAEELHKVLTAFRNEDPNGNGKKDEIPMFGKNTLNEAMTLWNARPSWYTDKGVVKYGPYEKEYRTAMENLIVWYKEGLMDQEILTRADNPRAKLLGNNVGGCVADWFGSTAAYNDSLADTVPGIKLSPIAPPSGKALSRRPVNSPYGWGVSASSENIEIAVRYLDFWYSEKGSNLMNFGKEGVHYDVVDGEIKFKEELLKGNIQTTLAEFGAQLDMGFKQNFEYERQWINDIAYEGMQLYIENDYFVEQFPTLTTMMSKEEIDEYSKLKTDIDTYQEEMMQKWLLGAEDIEKTWDSYIKNLEKFGVKRLIEMQQKAYEKMNAQSN